MTDRYAVFGNPVAHSLSPAIHRAFAAQLGVDMSYTRQLVAAGGFNAAATEFFQGGGRGLNVTVPFKQDAYRFATRLTPRARRAGAVNTLALQRDSAVLGDNTDGAGLVSDITGNLGWSIVGKRVLILGAGGAVRGILQPLLAQNPRELVIANRTVAKAQQLVGEFASLGSMSAVDLDGLVALKTFDVVINGTSASLGGDLPPLPDSLLAGAAWCYDMMYGAVPTVFMKWATEHGAVAVADGLGMLVEQAAESFFLWRGLRPATAPVIGAMRASLT